MAYRHSRRHKSAVLSAASNFYLACHTVHLVARLFGLKHHRGGHRH